MNTVDLEWRSDDCRKCRRPKSNGGCLMRHDADGGPHARSRPSSATIVGAPFRRRSTAPWDWAPDVTFQDLATRDALVAVPLVRATD